MSTVPVEECTADDETDYVNVKDGTGSPNNNINMSLQDTRMPSYYTGSWIWKADVPLLHLPPYLRPVSKCPFYTKKSLTAKDELQIQSSLPQTTFPLFWNTYLHIMSVGLWVTRGLFIQWQQFPKTIYRYEAVKGQAYLRVGRHCRVAHLRKEEEEEEETLFYELLKFLV